MSGRSCTRDDLRAIIVANVCVYEDGKPEPHFYGFGLAASKPYYCLWCLEEWDKWLDALGHLPKETDPELVP